MARFEELEVWRCSARPSTELYKALAEIKDYGFRDQITRAGLSIPSNMAWQPVGQGNGQFMSYAKDSAGEPGTRIYIGMDGGYIGREQGRGRLVEAEEIAKMPHAPIRAMRAETP
jgi:four helix bundle protein